MRFLIQRVSEANVKVNNKVIGEIKKGYLLFIGISNEDNEKIADKMIDKMIKLRIFEDENGKTNLSLKDVNGEILAISQFTLYANAKKGNRPSFIEAGNPEYANDLYEYILENVKNKTVKLSKGIFGEDMKVELINDGPFTIMLDSKDIF